MAKMAELLDPSKPLNDDDERLVPNLRQLPIDGETAKEVQQRVTPVDVCPTNRLYHPFRIIMRRTMRR